MEFFMSGRAEYPHEHIKKVNAYVGGYSSLFFRVSFPGIEIPFPSGSDISQVYIEFFVFSLAVDLFFKSNDGGVKPELENTVHFPPCFFFHF